MNQIEQAKRHIMNCPDCRGHIPQSWKSMLSWCPNCERMWKVTQSLRNVMWWYVTPVQEIIQDTAKERYRQVIIGLVEKNVDG